MSQTYPAPFDILSEYTPVYDVSQTTTPSETLPPMANVGCNRVVLGRENSSLAENNRHGRKFEPVKTRGEWGPLVIHEKRWYSRLVCGKATDFKRARALMDDFSLDDISRHMVVCFTPSTIPGRKTAFLNKEGKPTRIYAFFDSYVEFYQYMEKFPSEERAFYEIIFGELPQKPHFDIDIDVADFNSSYPNEDVYAASDSLRETVMLGCEQVLQDCGVTLDVERDFLLYNSHGPGKRSYHIVIGNKCHDDNKEAKAFYEAVMKKVALMTNGKYVEFVDMSVYSPRQQFRLLGCVKLGKNRVKSFDNTFFYKGIERTHICVEETTDLVMSKLVMLYESMVSFTSGCVFLPSLVQKPTANHTFLPSMPNVDERVINVCLNMLRNKMASCPFRFLDIKGHLIALKREAPSHCPICNRLHDNENPYMFIIGGKVYWDCRRAPPDTKKLFIGYLDAFHEEPAVEDWATFPSPNSQNDAPEEEEEETFTFGDYSIAKSPKTTTVGADPQSGEPEGVTVGAINDLINRIPKQPSTVLENRSKVYPPKHNPMSGTGIVSPIAGNATAYYPPPEQRRQNVQAEIARISREWAQRKYLRREAEDLMGTRRLNLTEVTWTTGLSDK